MALPAGTYVIGGQDQVFELKPEGSGEKVIQSNPDADRVPKYYVGIFNVSDKDVLAYTHWGKRGGGSVARHVLIPGRKSDQELYGNPYILKDIELVMRPYALSDEISYIPTKGELLAQDLLNPNNPGGDWRTYRDLGGEFTDSYYKIGLFWCRLESADDEPDFEALEMAIKRLETYYNGLVEEARQFWTGDPAFRKFIGRVHHDAAEYFHLSEDWHTQLTGGLSSRLDEMKKRKVAADKKKEPQV